MNRTHGGASRTENVILHLNGVFFFREGGRGGFLLFLFTCCFPSPLFLVPYGKEERGWWIISYICATTCFADVVGKTDRQAGQGKGGRGREEGTL